MNEKFLAYLRDIGLTETFIERITALFTICQQICPEGISDIFVSDCWKNPVEREYTDLFFFSPGYVLDIPNFLIADDIAVGISPFGSAVTGCGIKAKDYDFKTATAASRLSISLALPQEFLCNLQGSGSNCDHLCKLFRGVIKPQCLASG